MGAAQSAKERTVSMDNPSPVGVIDISDEVVQRLKQNIRQQAKESAMEKNTSSSSKEAPPKATPAATPAPPPPQPQQAKQVPVKSQRVVYQGPSQELYAMPGGITITASDVRRQKEAELQANDAQWRERMADLEKTLNKTNSIMESEYSTAVEDVKKRFANAAPVHQLPPCQDLKAKLIACYRAHPGETLMCSEEVAKFRNCVTEHRLKRLDAEKEKPAAAKAA